MKDKERIAELEHQVRELSRQLEELRQDNDAQSPAKAETDLAETPQIKSAGTRRKKIAVRIRHYWMSRVAVLVFMVVLALVAAGLFAQTGSGEAWQRILAGYAVAFTCLVFAWFSRARQHPLAQLLLGLGIASLYFSSYAAFFWEDFQVFTLSVAAWPLLAMCLLILVAATHARRSQIAAGVAVFVVYGTVVLSCTYQPSSERLLYALLACPALAIAVLLIHMVHRWRAFTWLVLLAVYFTFYTFFWKRPGALPLSEGEYFWLASAMLTTCFLAFSLACIFDARRSGHYAPTVTLLAIANSTLYVVWMWIPIQDHYPDLVWPFRLGLAAYLIVLAILAETAGSRRSPLAQFWLAKAVVLFSLGLPLVLPVTKLWPAFGLVALTVAVSYFLCGVVMLKLISVLLACTAFAGCLPLLNSNGELGLWGIDVPVPLFTCGGVALLLLAGAWFFDQAPPHQEKHTDSGKPRWFLGGTAFDMAHGTAAILFAGMAALLVLGLTIIHFQNDPALPYALAAEGALLCLAALVFWSRIFYFTAVLIFLSGHLTFYYLMWWDEEALASQDYYVWSTLLMALATFGGAFLWERFLDRVDAPRHWDHHMLAAFPYALATSLVAVLWSRILPPAWGPYAQNMTGVILLATAVAVRHHGPAVGGMFALAAGTATYFSRLYHIENLYAQQYYALLYTAGFLGTYALGERLMFLFERRYRTASKLDDLSRTILVATAGTLGILTLNRWAPDGLLTAYWVAHGIAGLLLGLIFRESRYRWAALLILSLAIARGFLYDLRGMSTLYQVLALAALLLVGATIAFAYAKLRVRRAKPTLERPGRGTHAEG